PSGSFKIRGIGHYCAQALSHSPDPSSVHFYSSSGGNAGLAAVHAAVHLGRPVTVVVPLSTTQLMMGRIRSAGASEVVQTGAGWHEADQYLRETLMARAEAAGQSAVYVPPFDHPDIWDGHSGMVAEMREQLAELCGDDAAEPDALVCSVGGGGLFNGIMRGLSRTSWSHVPVLAMETHGADSLNASLRAGELVTLPGITSLATCLGAVRVSTQCFEYARTSPNVRSVVLSDAEAAMGTWRLADDERIMVELACGVDVALCYGGRLEKYLGRKLTRESKVVIVICGGSNVTIEMIAKYRKMFGEDMEGRVGVDVEKDVPSNA
ncbi:hypothetical protein LTR28_002961, partial [Elasticomyces elasticus]